MHFFNRIKLDLFFVLFFSFLALFYYKEVINKGPQNTHTWRQTDCLSITRNYANGASFWQPEMHILLADNGKSGKSAGEFPILYYMVGQYWHLFGESYVSYRLFYLFILFLGLFSFYKSLQIIFQNSFWAFALSGLLFCSPVFVVYGVSFLTDAPAFSLVLIAIYFFIQYSKELDRDNRKLMFSMFFFTLAGLIKVSSLIAFFSLFVVLFMETLSIRTLSNRKLFKCNLIEYLGFGSVLIIIFSWYGYAHYYNEMHLFKYTFNNIYPIWKLPISEVKVLIKDIQTLTIPVYYSRTIIYSLVLIGTLNLFLFSRVPILVYIINILTILGSAFYICLWGPLFGVHDYYYNALLILFPGIIVPFIFYIKINLSIVFEGEVTRLAVSLLLLYNIGYCYNIIKLKTTSLSDNLLFANNPSFVGIMTWTNFDVGSNLLRYEEMKPYIKEIGILKSDKIICLSDESFNTTLFLCDQKGWTNFSKYSRSTQIDTLIQNGAKFLFVGNKNDLQNPVIIPFLTNKIGNFKGIDIFRLNVR